MKKFRLDSLTAVRNVFRYINSLSTDDGYMAIIGLAKDLEDRTSPQNKLYQAWSRIMAEELGYTHYGMKETLKRELLPSKIIKNLKGEEEEIWPETHKLGKKNFSVFLNKIDMLAADNGIILPKNSAEWKETKEILRSHRGAA